MNRVNFKNINTKSVDQSYFKPKVNVKVKKEVEPKPKYQPGNRKHEDNLYNWWSKDFGTTITNKGILEQIQDRKEYPKITIREEMKPNSEMTQNDLEDLIEIFKTDEVEKAKEEITKELISNDKRSYQDRGYYVWHGHYKYQLGGCSIKITDNVGGCGVQQLYGWGQYENNSKIPKLLKHILNDLNYGVGIVLCQVGSSYYNTLFCKTLEELGFKYHEEYKNHQHGGNDTGRIYTLIIEKNDKNKRITTKEYIK